MPYFPDSWSEEKKRIKRNEYRKRNYDKGHVPPDYRRWTDEEIKIVLDHSVTDREISKMIHRSVRCIQAIRYRKRKRGINNESLLG